MIYLDPPYQVIDGFSVLSDHEDPTLFYVIPPTPRLAQTPDGRPEFSLVQYLGGGAGEERLEGGLLTLTTELSVTDEARLALEERITERLGDSAPGTIRVVPVMYDSGNVELIALGGTSTPDENESPGESSGPFTLRFLGTGNPDLAGTNRATFQLLLDAPAAQLVAGALDSPELPIIAVYRMAFAGIRPSFQIDVEAEWHKVYRSLDNKLDVNLYYVAADVGARITEALEENNIEIDTQVFGTGERAQAAAERARKQLVDWVFERMFQPLVDPNAAQANAIGTVVEGAVSSLVRSVLPGVSYRLRILDEEQLRFFSARMNEAVAEQREVIPQGTLGGLLHRYRVDDRGQPNPEWETMKQSLLNQINLDVFPRLEVEVAAEDRFASDGVSQIIVDLGRLQADAGLTDRQSFTLRNAAERENYVVNLLGETVTSFPAPYQYRCEVHFDPSGPFGPHDEPIISDWQPGRTAELFVEPRLVYAVREVHASLVPTFSFEQFPEVTVELEHNAEGPASRQTGRIKLTQEQRDRTWRFRSFASEPLPFNYRVSYRRAAGMGPNIVTPWRQGLDDWLSIPDPLPYKRPLSLFVDLPWPEILVAFVRIRYKDDANGIHYDEQIDLKPDESFIRRVYPIAADGPRVVSYRLTLFMNDRQLLEGSWRETEEERLVLDRSLVETRSIKVRTIGGSLRENRLAEVRVGLQVRDPSTGQVRDETERVLTSDDEEQDLAPWEYLLGDPPLRTIHYSVLFIDRDGFTKRVDWQATEADLLVVHLGTQTVTA